MAHTYIHQYSNPSNDASDERNERNERMDVRNSSRRSTRQYRHTVRQLLLLAWMQETDDELRDAIAESRLTGQRSDESR